MSMHLYRVDVVIHEHPLERWLIAHDCGMKIVMPCHQLVQTDILLQVASVHHTCPKTEGIVSW